MKNFHEVSAILITREKYWPKDARIDFQCDVTTLTECPYVAKRFELAATAAYDTIYVQDDDVDLDIERLYKCYDGRLTNAIHGGHSYAYQNTGVTLIGFGCFFPRVMAERFMADEGKWRKKFGDELYEQEADRIFTFVNRPHNNVSMPYREFRRQGCMSMRHDHYKIRDRMIRELRDM